MPAGPLTVLGATGYTGRLCAAVAAHGHLPLRLAGRDRQRLDDLADELARATGARPEVRVVEVAEPGQLTALAADGGVVVSTVGPYGRLGLPVVDAVVAGGASLVDVSGELGYLRQVHDLDDAVRAAGVTVCPGAGFDGGPAELLAGLAAVDLDTVTEVRSATVTSGVQPSRGTVRSGLDIIADTGAALVGGALVAEPVAARAWTVPFPAPLGPRGAVSIPAPEILAVARSLEASTARAYLVTRAAWALSAAAQPLSWATRLASATPLWRVLETAAGRLREGPSPAQRAGARAAALVEVCGGGQVRRAWARLPDPYDVTARLVVTLARRLLAGDAEPGVCTPLEVVGTAGARAALEATGARVERLDTEP